MSDAALDQEPSKAGADDVPTAFWALGHLGRSSAWHFLLSILFIAAVFGVVFLLLNVALFALEAQGHDVFYLLDAQDWRGLTLRDAILGFAVPMAIIVLMLLPPVVLATWVVHGRSWLSLVTARRKFRWAHCLISFSMMFLMYSVLLGLSLLIAPEDLSYVFDPYPFLLFLPLVLVLVPLQVLAEEVVFRGYLLQLVGRFCARPLVIVLLPAALFWAGHLQNDPVRLGGIWAILDYAVFSLYVTYLALDCDGLEHPIGIHLGTNLYVFLVQGHEGIWNPTPTLFVTRNADFALSLLALVVVLAIHYLLVIRPARGLRRARA